MYKDCVIIYNTGKGVRLRATKITVVSEDSVFIVYDHSDVMAIIPFSEIKTVLFCDAMDAETLCEVIGGQPCGNG